ncbi:MAG: GMC family oxidoreductase [Candidatus Competibacterales bacterium]
MVRYDYIIVGGGTAGCVLANRLSADPTTRVLMCEAGPPDNAWILHMPAGLRSVFKPSSRFNWWFETTPQPHLDGRTVAQPRGKTLGGSSSINGMTFLRGHPKDYDDWEALGCRGWNYARCLPVFRDLEHCGHGDDRYRGRTGPVGVQRQERLSPLNEAFLAAGAEAGFPASDDPNGGDPEGFCRFDMSVFRGRRSSAARCYLHPIARRPNLAVVTGCLVHRVHLKGPRAVGVALQGPGGAVETVAAEREVILCAGAFASPQLLMLSGIGPPDHLGRHGIAVRHPLPGVGQNLQDHLEVHVQVETHRPVSLNRELQPHRMLWAGLQWFVAKRGVAAVNQCHVGAFVKSEPGLARPDLQMHFFPLFFDAQWLPRPDVYGYRLGVGPVRPKSRGSVTLSSARVTDPPLIDPNYLALEEDRRAMVQGLNLAREILAQPAFRPFHQREWLPGSDIRSKAALAGFIRAHAASAYHPCGTCAMGPDDDPEAVVDPQLRVRGLEGLRVVDASVMPRLVGANINPAVLMIAERGARAILAPG